MRINALLSGFSPVAARGGENSFPPAGGVEKGARQESVPADVFVQGQPWRNLAAATPPAAGGARPCACKTCPACAAMAYAEQGGVTTDGSAPAAPVAGKEGKTGEDSGPSGEAKIAAATDGQQGAVQEEGESAQEKPQGATGPKGVDGETLTQAERLQVAELELIDTKVRAHEMAHLAAAGSYATGGANFQYAKGPDGKRYAVGGEVGIDTGKESTPEATISKMQTVRAAALAPADPSPQDRKVAAAASLMITEAGQELQMIRLEQAKEKAGGEGIVQDGAVEPGEQGVAPKARQGRESASGEGPAPKAQNPAAAIAAGLMRPPSRIHIAV